MIKKVLIYSIISIVIFYIAQGIYNQINKSCASKRLECQKEVVVFEKIYQKDKLFQVKEYIEQGNFSLHVKEQKSIYMKSTLFEHLKIEDVQSTILNSLKKYQKSLHVKDAKLDVNVLVYENDKDDPGKKTSASKLYSGYLVFSFSIDKSLVYKVQIDFMEKLGEDIPKRVECALKSIMSLKD